MSRLRTPPAFQADPLNAVYFERLNGRVNVASIADLNQTITNPPTQAEVQAISDKVDELLAALRAAETMDS